MYKFFDKKTGPHVNKVVAQELHKPVIKKFKRRKMYSRFKYDTWAADLTLFSFNGNVKYFLCVIDLFTKYSSIKLWLIKKPKSSL